MSPTAADPGVEFSAEACALAAVDLYAGYDGRLVLQGVTLPVSRGRITVLMGPSGVGKTTCIRHLVGLAKPLRGQVLIDGQDLVRMSDEEIRQQQRRMSVMLQGSTLFGAGLSWSLSVFDNVALPLRVREALSEEEIASRVKRQLAQFGLTRRAGALPGELSAGQLQRVSLARALVSNSEIVVLDSVESGMDGVRLTALGQIIRCAQRESGATFLLATHNPQLARALADVLAIIRRGRIETLGPPLEALGDGTGFASRFLEGDPMLGIGMRDELEALHSATPRPPPKEATDRQVAWLTAMVVIAMVAIVLTLLIAWLVYRGPNVLR